jgi:hypothetical protein
VRSPSATLALISHLIVAAASNSTPQPDQFWLDVESQMQSVFLCGWSSHHPGGSRVGNQDPLGSDRYCSDDRARRHLGSDAVDRLAVGFEVQLGQPWFYVWPGLPIYLPPALFWWWYLYDAYAPRIFLEGACIAASGGLMSAAVAFGLSIWRARDRAVETYGSARWATPTEVRRAGLLGPDGVVLGRYRGAYLRHDGPEHVLCFAPTRSGKDVGLVVPSLGRSHHHVSSTKIGSKAAGYAKADNAAATCSHSPLQRAR